MSSSHAGIGTSSLDLGPSSVPCINPSVPLPLGMSLVRSASGPSRKSIWDASSEGTRRHDQLWFPRSCSGGKYSSSQGKSKLHSRPAMTSQSQWYKLPRGGVSFEHAGWPPVPSQPPPCPAEARAGLRMSEVQGRREMEPSSLALWEYLHKMLG